MAYRYEAYTPDKRIVRGTIGASSERAAEGILYGEGYARVLRLQEIRNGAMWERWLPSLFGVKTQDVIEFSYQLATLIESGMPIITALGLLEKQTSKAALRRIIAGLSIELQGGGSFSQALSKYPQVFSDIYCQVVRASEHTGNLALALKQASGYIEKNMIMTAGIIRTLTYPSLVLLMAIGVVILITNVALPPLVRLFTSLDAELPWTTKLLMFAADFVAGNKFYLLGGFSILLLFFVVYIRLPSGKLAMDKFILKIPMIDHIVISRDVSQFCRTTSLLLEAGVSLPHIMSIAIGTVNNSIIRQALVEVRQKLVQGQGLSQPMANNALFPELLVEMVVVGEKTGTLPSTLATLSDFYEQTVDRKIRLLVSTVQHSLMVMIGVAVGFIGISMITPLYSILKTIH
ncbi:type II secretion system F family protein [Chloroflexota bacterium]